MDNPILQQRPQNESELQQILADILRANGWTAVREYSPDWANKRIDIFAEHDEYGRIGFETKYIRSDRNGARLAEGYLQITRDYWRRSFNGDKISLWALAPYYSPSGLDGIRDDRLIRDFVREFITRTGVGVVNCHAPTLKILYAANEAAMSIPIAGPHTEVYEHRVDLEAIRELVAERKYERVD